MALRSLPFGKMILANVSGGQGSLVRVSSTSIFATRSPKSLGQELPSERARRTRAGGALCPAHSKPAFSDWLTLLGQRSIPHLHRKLLKHGLHFCGCCAIKHTFRNVGLAPDHGFRRVVQHGPICEKAFAHRF